MAKRQFRVKTPQHDSPKDRVQWAIDELNVLVSASAAKGDVVTPGMVVPRGSGGSQGGLHIRRGWLGGMSVSVATRESLDNRVDVTVIPTSKLQSSLLSVLFFGFLTAGLSVGCSLGGSEWFVGAIAGFFVGLFAGVTVVAVVQRLGIAVTKDTSGAVDALAADVGRWAEQRNAIVDSHASD